MSIVQTTLIFAGIPIVATLLVTAMIYARSAERGPRYRPGGPWPYEPVWYLPHPDHSGPVSSMHPSGPAHTGHRAALPAGELAGAGQHAAGRHHAGARAAITGRVAEPVTASGGASGEW